MENRHGILNKRMRRTFSQPTYVVIALFAAFAAFFLITGVPRTTFTFLFQYAAFASTLIGVNIALLVSYIRLSGGIPSFRAITSGLAGSFLALLGFGCVSIVCSPVSYAGILIVFSGVGLSVIVPYVGIIAGIAGIGLLVLSVVIFVRAINQLS